ncbi:MAG: hypothetical protein ACRCR9_00145 [Chitinophagaceae bacterium]
MEITLFEDIKKQNGKPFWYSNDLMDFLGITENNEFNKLVTKASKVLLSLNIDLYEEIRKEVAKYKLSRFACYVIVMEADASNNIKVAQAKAYFARMTELFEQQLASQQENIERIDRREDIKQGNTDLFKVVEKAGIEDYAKFNNAGYIGMYNMLNRELAASRKYQKKNLLIVWEA